MPSAMGIFASVVPGNVTIGNPNTLVTDVAASTIGEAAGIIPAGAAPSSFHSARTAPGRFHRAFSVSTAWATACLTAAVSARRDAGSCDRMSISIHASKAIELIEVPPPVRPMLKVVFRVGRNLDVGDLRDRASHCVHRVGRSECVVTVPAATKERHAIPLGANGEVGEADARAVDRKKPVDTPAKFSIEKMSHASLVADSFFSDIGDERDRARRDDFASIERTDHAQHRRQAAAVVANARPCEGRAVSGHGEIGPFRENRIEMCGEQQVRSLLLSRPLADHVAERVNANAAQPQFLEQRMYVAGALLLVKCRRRDLTESDLIIEDLRLTGASCLHRIPHRGIRQQAIPDCARPLLRGQTVARKQDHPD